MKHSVFPNSTIQKSLKKEVDLRLLDSLEYLIQLSSKGLNKGFDSIFSKIESTKAKINSNNILDGLLYVLHTKLKSSLEVQNVKDVEMTIQLIEKFNFLSSGLRIDSIDAEDFNNLETSILIEVSKFGYESSYGKTPDMLPLRQSIKQENIANVKKTLETIKELHLPTYEELNVTVSDILLYESKFMNSGSSVNALGIIKMSALRPYQNWTTFVEAIAHEAGHQALYNIMLIEPVLEPGKHLYDSPLRKEKRPMIGIFHALFVVSRIVMMTRLLNKKLTRDDDNIEIISPHNNSGNDDPAEVKFNNLYRTVKENAKLTKVGSDILESCCEMVNNSELA